MATFPASFDLSSLNGENGFTLNGIGENDFLGRAVSSAGDINGDGFDDVILGASVEFRLGIVAFGESYVVFGSDDRTESPVELSALNGQNGFNIPGPGSLSFLGTSVGGAGDINGDGIDDFIVGAPGANPLSNDFTGQSYVVFGSQSFSGETFDVRSLNGSNGVIIKGIDTVDFVGASVSITGDINNDGIDDLIIGAPESSSDLEKAGRVFVVFGSESFGSDLDQGVLELSSLDGRNGIIINGLVQGEYLGVSVSDTGDINGDGIDDFVIGASAFNSDTQPGRSYVVFGSTAFGSGDSPTLDLASLDGSNGFIVNGPGPERRFGESVSGIGDFNSDGLNDFIIGTQSIFSDEQTSVGKSYVIYGSTGFDSGTFNLDALNGRNGFVIEGADIGDLAGSSVSSAGDVNGDGLADLIVGAPGGDPDGEIGAGESYVIYGSTTFDAPAFALSSIDGRNGFVINGIDAGDGAGGAVSSAGDVNGDGFDDLIVSAASADPNGESGAGEGYIIYGGPALSVVTVGDENTIERAGGNDSIFATAANDTVNAGAGADSVYGRSGNDLINGGSGNDFLLGQDGKDIINGEDGDDIIFGDEGDDTLSGDAGNDVIYGRNDNDVISGDDGDDVLSGDAGNDNISGGIGSDTLKGGAGDDTLEGSSGIGSLLVADDHRDVLIGGSGRDHFVIQSSYAINGDSDYALIQDFSASEDAIAINAGDFSLQQTSSTLPKGVGLYNGGDLVAVISGYSASELSLAESYFTT